MTFMEGALGRVVTSEAQDFSVFYEANFTLVHRAALAFTGDHELALDAAQESFARAYARWRRLSKKPWSSGWVITTALNICRRRSSRERHEVHLVSDRLPERDKRTDDRIDLLRALRRLPHRRRSAVILFYMCDYPVRVVADLMNLSEGAVKAHLFLARKELRKEMGDWHD